MNDKFIAIHKIMFAIGALCLGVLFTNAALEQSELAEKYREGYEIQEEFVINNEIDFSDPEPWVDWMDNIEISQSDSDPLEIGETIGAKVLIEVKELPKEIAVHIFHEDMTEFFVGNGKSDFKQLSEDLGRVPSLRYSDMFNVDFEEQEIREGQESYSLNGLGIIELKKDGTYFASVSVKTDEGVIDHYKSKTSVFEVVDPQEIWIKNTLQNLINVAEDQKADTKDALGIAFYAIGTTLIFTGIAFLFSAYESYRMKRT